MSIVLLVPAMATPIPAPAVVSAPRLSTDVLQHSRVCMRSKVRPDTEYYLIPYTGDRPLRTEFDAYRATRRGRGEHVPAWNPARYTLSIAVLPRGLMHGPGATSFESKFDLATTLLLAVPDELMEGLSVNVKK